MWRAPLALFLLYRELFSDRELHDACTLKNLTMLPDTASLLHPCDTCTSCGELRSLFSDRELFTDRELHEARTPGKLLTYVRTLI